MKACFDKIKKFHMTLADWLWRIGGLYKSKVLRLLAKISLIHFITLYNPKLEDLEPEHRFSFIEILANLRNRFIRNNLGKIDDAQFIHGRGINILVEFGLYKRAEKVIRSAFNYDLSWKFDVFKAIEVTPSYNSSRYSFRKLYPQFRQKVKYPKYINRFNIPRRRRKITNRPVGVFQMHEKMSIVNGWHIFSNDKSLFLKESASVPWIGFSSGLFDLQWSPKYPITEDCRDVLICWKEQTEEIIEKAVLLGPRVDNNYFKFLIDVVPKFRILKDLFGDNIPEILIKSQDLYQINQVINLLRNDFNIRFIEKEVRYQVQELVLPSPVNFHPDTTNIAWWAGSGFNVTNLEWLSYYFKQKLKVSTKSPFRKIYITSKRSYRKIVNEDEIRRLFYDKGFDIIDPAKMNFDDQVRIFSEAEEVWGATGAWLANMVFMNRGTKINCFISQGLRDYYLHFNMAQSLGIDFKYFIGKTTTKLSKHMWREGWLHSDYQINYDQLSKKLS